MDSRIKAVLDDEFKEHPLYPFYLTYFERFVWNEELKDFIDTSKNLSVSSPA